MRYSVGRDGFTLIELLVVISIISLLVGILLPALSAARAQGRQMVCLSNVRLLATSALMYAQDDKLGRWVPFITGIDRKILLAPYTNSGTSNADPTGMQIWVCPEQRSWKDANDVVTEAGYGLSSKLNNEVLYRIFDPSNTVALCDAGIRDDGQPITATHVMPPSVSQPSPTAGRPNPRHDQKRLSVGWVDGHANTQQKVLPFYPKDVSEWTGGGVTDRASPLYQDQLWDRY